MARKVTAPVVAPGGLGCQVAEIVKMVAKTVEAHTFKDYGPLHAGEST